MSFHNATVISCPSSIYEKRPFEEQTLLVIEDKSFVKKVPHGVP